MCDYDANVDYFADKLTTEYATGFEISYHKSYKLITALGKNLTYVAYQCGTPDPLLTAPEYHTYVPIEIPLRGVALVSTSYVPYFEYINQRDSIEGKCCGW